MLIDGSPSVISQSSFHKVHSLNGPVRSVPDDFRILSNKDTCHFLADMQHQPITSHVIVIIANHFLRGITSKLGPMLYLIDTLFTLASQNKVNCQH